MRCYNCNAIIDREDALYCSKCGSDMLVEENIESTLNEKEAQPQFTYIQEREQYDIRFPEAEPVIKYGGIFRRFFAAIIDFIIIIFITCIIGVLTYASDSYIGLMVMLVNIFYAGLSESSRSMATLGKICMGLQVTDVYFNKISFARAVMRNILKMASLISIIGFIGYFLPLFNKKNRALHDLMSGCVVIRKHQ